MSDQCESQQSIISQLPLVDELYWSIMFQSSKSAVLKLFKAVLNHAHPHDFLALNVESAHMSPDAVWYFCFIKLLFGGVPQRDGSVFVARVRVTIWAVTLQQETCFVKHTSPLKSILSFRSTCTVHSHQFLMENVWEVLLCARTEARNRTKSTLELEHSESCERCCFGRRSVASWSQTKHLFVLRVLRCDVWDRPA